jgi:hypothetical protein
VADDADQHDGDGLREVEGLGRLAQDVVGIVQVRIDVLGDPLRGAVSLFADPDRNGSIWSPPGALGAIVSIGSLGAIGSIGGQEVQDAGYLEDAADLPLRVADLHHGAVLGGLHVCPHQDADADRVAEADVRQVDDDRSRVGARDSVADGLLQLVGRRHVDLAGHGKVYDSPARRALTDPHRCARPPTRTSADPKVERAVFRWPIAAWPAGHPAAGHTECAASWLAETWWFTSARRKVTMSTP